ncbi:MerR family transcriptional regulator [Roseivirga misakiensis]|uniref:MerR family transcriptional regulator n=1 Tax=Roseivirga misakiensis TaxID=1563681 RepID=UPI0015B4BC0A|nr:MerR family transcriptional regulator [Roseivirga misakiensis]
MYSIKALAELANVSIRTLHHYDNIGLLSPANRSDKGYRFYQKEELYRLQQIMFYKTLGYELSEIKRILDSESFDLIDSLNRQRKALLKKSSNLQKLIITIDKTINELKNKEGMITDEEMYEGFSKADATAYEAEVKARWGDEVEEAKQNIQAMSKQGWKDTKQEAEEINLWLANLIHKPANDREVQQVIQLHFQHIQKFYEVSEERYRGLANMYLEDERFKKHYDEVKPGLAEFLSRGMHQFCDNGMKV